MKFTRVFTHLLLLSQTLAIDKWNTDSVEEFLDIYLYRVNEEDLEEP